MFQHAAFSIIQKRHKYDVSSELVLRELSRRTYPIGVMQKRWRRFEFRSRYVFTHGGGGGGGGGGSSVSETLV